MLLIAKAIDAHPVHLTITNLKLNDSNDSIACSIKLFYDDFQSIINYKYGTNIELETQDYLNDSELKAINKYIGDNFKIHSDSILMTMEFAGWDFEGIMVNLSYTFVLDCVPNEAYYLLNTLMLEYFIDQKNLVIIGHNNPKGYEFNNNVHRHEIILNQE